MKYARLVVLGVALGAGLLAARMVMNSKSPEPQVVVTQADTGQSEEVLVASRDIVLGSKLSPKDLEWTDWPQDAVPKGAILKSSDPEARSIYTGQIAKAPIYDGEPIRAQRLIDTEKGFMAAMLPKGMRAIAVSVEAETTAGGFILPGDKIDLILTQTGEGNSAVSETILENVRVLAIDETTAGEQDKKSLSPKRTATLELTLDQAEIVAQSQQVGTISLALRSAQDSSDDEVDVVRKRGGVSFVKYGVSSQAPTR
ncbi:Flp pilus assembly protein CpaB [Roseibium polysiphoniae]|uniref:Flp pilus assembly protein CpaB n=1 Tax=Roseibium polysiphoniae TaxID=2571221 RepID=A0A927KDU9_9HYPH|nr:Flp pilus assembly protein CpaB [Roseibium polysiphoniae]MBD8878319.1 Flp pilus assembly protein CpaB [Roseibium polysiphoniae]MBS8262500.1 Flp pilus assembly protein CpaB [Roseibium polysiphoniae]